MFFIEIFKYATNIYMIYILAKYIYSFLFQRNIAKNSPLYKRHYKRVDEDKLSECFSKQLLHAKISGPHLMCSLFGKKNIEIKLFAEMCAIPLTYAFAILFNVQTRISLNYTKFMGTKEDA